MGTKTRQKEIVIALAGNPNSGKTTVFNELTGSHQHVGNWPGVTVERKEGIVRKDGHTFRVVDLPGIYSLAAYSQDEILARDFLINNHVDVIVNVVDASNLERNLYLTTQLLELGIGMVIALNMVDMALEMGQEIDLEKFSRFLGADVIPTVASKGKGVDEILRSAAEAAHHSDTEAPRSPRQNPEVETEIAKLQERLQLKPQPEHSAPLRWFLIKALEGDKKATQRLSECSVDPDLTLREVENTRHHLENHFGDDLEAVIADGRYGFVGGLLREVVTRRASHEKLTITDKIDSILLNRVLGIPIFLVLMWLTFEITFCLGGIVKNWMDKGVSALGTWTAAALPHGPLSSLVTNGIIAGVGGVIVFLPNIILLFAVISFLEDSGYMARAAFLMDRSMHSLGLHGKSFIPMLMGFGCNVPAVMAARTLESPADRIKTILITPFMSCSARLPIYILFAGIFFPQSGAWVILSLYVLGVLLAVVSGKLFGKLFFAKSVSPFVMELPPYRLPTLKGTVIHVWERGSLFLSKAGTTILAISVVIWALGSLPWGVPFGSDQSIVGHMGRLMEPIVRPLGMDWRAAVALFFGMGAKEIVVSTLGVLYSTDHGAGALPGALSRSYTRLTAYVFMVISLIYIPCIATVAIIKRETNSWKWTLLAVVYSLLLAYVVGFGIYRVGLIAGFR